MAGNNLTRRDFVAAVAASALMPSVLPVGKLSEPAIAPFHYRAPDEALDDLKRRLAQTRWPDHETILGWEQGVPSSALRTLAHYWSTKYDWRTCESSLAQWPQFMTRIDGLDFHFIHVQSRHPNALPMILTHGWPSNVLLFRDVIGPLTDPTSHGGSAEDALDVVIPSLPGFGFSGKPEERGWNAQRTARAWSVLMQRVGCKRYVAQGVSSRKSSPALTHRLDELADNTSGTSGLKWTVAQHQQFTTK